MAVLGLNLDPPASQENGLASPAYPATAVFDLRSRADATALTARILTLGQLDGESGGIYPLPPQRGAAVIDAGQLEVSRSCWPAGLPARRCWPSR